MPSGNSPGRAHGRGGPDPKITQAQRDWATNVIENTPRGQRTAKVNELAMLLDVHPNTLRYRLKKNSGTTGTEVSVPNQ